MINSLLTDLFEVISGNGFDLNKVMIVEKDESEWINFVSRSARNQGVAARVKIIPTKRPFDAGLITVALGGTMLSSFVQQFPFYTAEHMKVLKPKKDMTLQEKLYYCLCIKKNNLRYTTHGREADRTIKILELPTNPTKWIYEKKTTDQFQDGLSCAFTS